MATCQVCNNLWQLLTRPLQRFDKKSRHEEPNVNLGSFNEALTSHCSDHTQIIKQFQEHCIGGKLTFSRGPSSDVGFFKDTFGQSMTLTESLKDLGYCWELMAVKKPGVNDHPGVGRVLDPEWIDLDIITKWKRECHSTHGDKCENPMRILPAAPTWLVDVELKCIVPGDGKRFVALSYRSSNDVAHRSSIAELEQHGSLDDPEVLAKIPLKVQHAMSVTAAMDERYLWADYLCFDYSDPTTISEQLSLMTSIYAGAVVTIIAADGDRTDGIHGLKSVSNPRTLNQKIFPLGDEQLVVRQSAIFSLENFHGYHDRGWTYQEFKMSPRKLLFMNGQVHWQCNCTVWHEEITLGGKVDTYIDPRPSVLSSGFPDFGSLQHMLDRYNKRNLTYDEDAMAAIAGLLAVFSRTFTGGFLYGLPEMFFDHALAWKPHWPHTNLRKRKPSGKPADIRFAVSDFPTWSWVAWQGLFRGWEHDAVRVNCREDRIEEFSPITEWYTSSAPSGQPLRRIRSTWFENRDSLKDVDKPLPDGWTRLPAPKNGSHLEEPMLYPDGCGQYIYQHHALPDDDCETWYYPFPVPHIDLSTPYFIPEQTRYLFCKTGKTSLWSHRVHHWFSRAENHELALHKTAQGPQVGALHLQTDEQLALWPEARKEDGVEVAEGRIVELVAINRSVLHSKTFYKETKRWDRPVKREERVGVLWVEWEDGVAYRLACGHVDKDAWESLEKETVDLVLG